MNSGRRLQRRRGGALRRVGWLAAATLLSVSVFAPVASAAEPSQECIDATQSFEYSVDGGPFQTVHINDGPSEYPQNTVTVRVKEGVDLPVDCERKFGLTSFTAGGASWPDSVYEHFLDYDTATLSNTVRSATLTIEVPGDGCFGQTDFYTDVYTNGIFFPGDTKYEGALEPHYPDVPTPYGKISGANGGERECLETEPPTEPPTPTPPTPTPSESTPTEPEGAIEIFKIDNKGTGTFLDDTFLPGASFAVYKDNGDSAFSAGTDTLVAGPAAAVGGVLEVDNLTPGNYWIVETVVPAGFVGTDPILITLNTDSNVVCTWDRTGSLGCDQDVDGALDVVFVDNTPNQPPPSGSDEPAESERPSPSGSVGGATGTPNVTPPSTDTFVTGSSSTGGGWRVVLAGLAVLIAIALVFTQPARISRPR